jgi:dienelactone hydrolase
MRALVLTLFFAVAAHAAGPRYWGSLTPGPFHVGFRIMEAKSGPGAVGIDPRPVEIALWYPAAGKGERMSFGDYFALSPDLRARSAPAGTSADDLPAVLSAAITGDASVLPTGKAEAILSRVMFAVRDAAPAAGQHRIVLWTARYGTTAAQSVLSEFLASHGLIVAAVRPLGVDVRLPFELKTPVEKSEELQARVDDMRGALHALRELPIADPDDSALLAWSYAGEAATMLQTSDARISTVVGLSTNLLSGWVFLDPAHALHMPRNATFLHLSEKDDRFKELAHGNFNALEGMIPAVEGIDRVQPWSKPGPEGKAGYERIARDLLAVIGGSERQQGPPRDLALRSADGTDVHAELYAASPPRRGCVLLMHQSGSSRGEYRGIAPELARWGFDALAIDLRWGRRDRWNDVWNETARRYGTIEIVDSGDRERMRKIDARPDIDAGITALRARGCSAVILWGSSIHANRAMERAVRDPEGIAAVVAFSPGEYGPNPTIRQTAAKMQRRALLLFGKDEPDIVATSVPETFRTVHRSDAARHGSAVLFDDPGTWKVVKNFIEPEPNDAQGWFALGASKHEAGDYRGALVAFDKAAENGFQPRPLVNARRARALVRAGDHDAAIALLQQMVAGGYPQAEALNAENDFLAIRADSRWPEIVDKARRNQHPCANAPQYRQFDYWLGEWDVEVRGQRTARSSIQLILDDCVIFENFWTIAGAPYAGKSFSVWDAHEKRWEQQYVDTNGGSRTWIGSLEGERLVFYLRGQGPTPATVNRMTYTREGADRVRQLIEVSTDDGKTWTPGFDGLYIRRGSPPTARP